MNNYLRESSVQFNNYLLSSSFVVSSFDKKIKCPNFKRSRAHGGLVQIKMCEHLFIQIDKGLSYKIGGNLILEDI